jgi:hypothetical protein
VESLTNPYTPGAGAPPPSLAGRDEELDAFRLLIGRLGERRHENSLILFGLRGVGKTVLLGEMEQIAEASDWQAISIEVRASADFMQTLARALVQVTRKLRPASSRATRAIESVRSAIASLEATYSDRGWSLSVKAAPEEGVADSGDLDEDLAEVLVGAARAAQEAGSGIALFIDEMQLMPRRELEALVAAFHRASRLQIPLCLAGAGLPQLPGLIAEAKTYAERLFTYRRIDSLTDAAARQALELAAADSGGVTFEPAAVSRVLERSSRYPYFLQVYGKRVWDAAPASPITEADVEVVIPDVQEELDMGFFHVRWEKATRKERDYMSAMAALGDGAQTTSAIVERLGRKRLSDLSPQRDTLIKKGLIYSPDHGLVDFTAPLFADFVRRTHPLNDR